MMIRTYLTTPLVGKSSTFTFLAHYRRSSDIKSMHTDQIVGLNHHGNRKQNTIMWSNVYCRLEIRFFFFNFVDGDLELQATVQTIPFQKKSFVLETSRCYVCLIFALYIDKPEMYNAITPKFFETPIYAEQKHASCCTQIFDQHSITLYYLVYQKNESCYMIF